MNQRPYITSFGNVQRYCQDFVFTCTLSCAYAYTNAIFKVSEFDKIWADLQGNGKINPSDSHCQIFVPVHDI